MLLNKQIIFKYFKLRDKKNEKESDANIDKVPIKIENTNDSAQLDDTKSDDQSQEQNEDSYICDNNENQNIQFYHQRSTKL